MKKRTVIITYFLVSHLLPAMAAVNPVVIQHQEDHYKFVADKKGGLEKIEHTNTTTFRTSEDNQAATSLAYYNDFIKLGGVSGDVTSYGPFMSDDEFFSDSKACIIGVNLKKAGASAKTRYKRTFTKPEFCDNHIIYEPYRIEKQTIIFELPASLADRYSFRPLNVDTDRMCSERTQNGNKVKYTFTINDIDKPKHFDDAPSVNVTSPQILILGHFADVHDIYRYLYSYLPTEDPGADAVVAKARELTANCRTDKERIDSITSFVYRAIRYIAVEHGEFDHRPDLPSEVLRKLYGDCKCSAALLRAMFRAVGIDGRYVWVGNNSIPYSWTENPSVGAGNHMIAAAMTGDSILFIDGTTRHARVGLIPQSYQGREVIIEDTPQKCIVATVPEYGPGQCVRTDSISLAMLPSGNIEMQAAIHFHGQQRSMIAYAMSHISAQKRDQFQTDIIKYLMTGIREPKVLQLNITDSSACLRGKASITGTVTPSGQEMYIDLNPNPELASLRFDTTDRTVPGLLYFRRTDLKNITLTLPEGYKVKSLPVDITVNNEWIYCNIHTEVSDDGSKLTRDYRLTTKQLTIPAEKLQEFNRDINRLIRACSAKIGIQTAPITETEQ